MRWTRQRRAAVLRPGRGPAEERRPQGSLRSRTPREAGHRGGRRRCAVRTGVEMRPIRIALRGGPNRVVPTEIRSAADASKSGRRREPAETTASRLRPLPGRARSKPTDHRVRNAGRCGAFVVTTLVCFLQLCTRGCGRTWRPAFRAPSFRKEGAGNTHNPGASAPRDRGNMAVIQTVIPGRRRRQPHANPESRAAPALSPSLRDSGFAPASRRSRPGMTV